MLKGSKASVGTKPNREQWLDEAVSELSAIFKERGYEVPPVRVSCGFAHTSSRSVIGQCWSTKSSDAAINEIFISPKLADPVEVLDTLTHELVHAVDNCEHKHGKEFKAIAQRIGLQGKMREASAGPALKQKLTAIALKLGNYPHAKLAVPVPSPSFRSRPRAVCERCGFRVPMLKSWIHYGPPVCPVDQVLMEKQGDWD